MVDGKWIKEMEILFTTNKGEHYEGGWENDKNITVKWIS